MAYPIYEDHRDDNDESESVTPAEWFPEPDECDECKAWCYDASDHAPDCPHYEEQPLPF